MIVFLLEPDNFLIGKGAHSRFVYMIDFGLSKRYKSTRSGLHIPYRENKSLTGTARYASISSHNGIEQSRRDDLESIGHVIIYLCKGKLPWQGLKAKTKHKKYEKIRDTKMRTKIPSLCKGLPRAFAEYLGYVRGLAFVEDPDYTYMRGLFRTLFKEKQYEFDYKYDWDLLESEEESCLDMKELDTALEATQLTPEQIAAIEEMHTMNTT